MKHGSQNTISLSFLLGLLLVFTPYSTLYAQDEDDDSVEEIFWGDDRMEDSIIWSKK